MKKLFLFLSIISSQLNAESLKLEDLSPYEQSIHRVAWCHEAWDHGVLKLETHKIYDIIELLNSKNFKRQDINRLYEKARNDLRAELILGTKVLKQNDLDICFKDLKGILAENYTPNFSYMDN